MRVLLWNTHRNEINNYIASLIKEQQIDLFFATEYVDSIADLCERIGSDSGFEQIPQLGCERIMTFGEVDSCISSFHNKYCTMVFEEELRKKMTIMPGYQKIIYEGIDVDSVDSVRIPVDEYTFG